MIETNRLKIYAASQEMESSAKKDHGMKKGINIIKPSPEKYVKQAIAVVTRLENCTMEQQSF